jgi:large subunit ribosomal protein L19
MRTLFPRLCPRCTGTENHPSEPFRLMHPLIAKINQEQMKQDVPSFNVGDSVKVHTRVIEGNKERIQIFAGLVIDRNGGKGLGGSFTVRKISYGEGVERVFPLHSPRVAKVEVVRQGKVRRAKLSYLRGRQGKEATSVKELKESVSA